MGVIVRFVTHADYLEWLQLWDGYNRFYGRFEGSRWGHVTHPHPLPAPEGIS